MLPRALCLSVAFLAAAGSIQAQSSSGASATPQDKLAIIGPGKSLVRALAGGQRDIYEIHMDAGQFLHAAVEQLGIDVALTLRGPDVKTIGSMDMESPVRGLPGLTRSNAALCLMTAGLAAQFLLCTSLSAQDTAAPQSNSVARSKRLKIGKTRKGRLQGGQSQNYVIRAQAGVFVHIVVEQEGSDLALTLSNPSGKQIAQMHMSGREPISTITEISGNLQLRVAPVSKTAPVGRYEIKLADMNAPTEANRARINAERTYMDAQQLLDQKQYDAAVSKWEESARLWHGLDDPDGEGISLHRLGVRYHLSLQMQKALDFYNQALPLESKAGDPSKVAFTLMNMAAAENYLQEFQKAIDYYSQALPIERALGSLSGEASLLFNRGGLYTTIGNQKSALDDDNNALQIQRKLGSRKDMGATLGNMGLAYTDLGEQQKALGYFTQSLAIAREVGDRSLEGRNLSRMGNLYSDLGEKEKALDLYTQALRIQREVKDQRQESHTLMNMGIIYRRLGEMERALDYYNQALMIVRETRDRAFEAATLLNIGNVYGDLGEYQKALGYEEQALELMRAVGDQTGEARTLNDMAVFNQGLGEKQKALENYNQAISIERLLRDRPGEARTLISMGGIYIDLGEIQKAREFLGQALSLERAVEDRDGEAMALADLAEAYNRNGEMQKALDNYNQSLPLFRGVQDPLHEGEVLANLMEYWKGEQNPSLAVLFGKQAIDRFQQLRRGIKELAPESQQSFLKSKESYYRELAELLISQGRLPEAQQVLDLLKLEEYSEFTQRRGDKGSDTKPLALTPNEEKANKEYELITADITAIGSEYSQLQAKSHRSADEEKRLNELSDKLTAANNRYEVFLAGLYVSFGKGDPANNTVNAIKDKMALLQAKLGEGDVGIYTAVSDHKCDLIVITPATQVVREVQIEKMALRSKVYDFLAAFAQHQPENDIQSKAQDFYKILIAPIEKDLQGAQAKTLVWSLEDVLRYVPVAALYDGKQYLVERYRNVVITTVSFGNLDHQPQLNNLRGLAMGVSKVYNPEDGLGPLSAVPGELRSVVHSTEDPASHGPVSGSIMLDDAFTETSMESALERHPPVVHIASHYVFQPGDDSKSYLLLGGKEKGGQGFHLTLPDMRDDQRMDFKGIELFTLSGCKTGLGSNDPEDGREIDDLAITLQRKGAQAVVASLWEVEDASASVGQLMANFYKQWITTPGSTKVQALQQAQLALLHGSESQYRNPYYWAPFILIGNWK